jgi:outer membrane protein TolC
LAAATAARDIAVANDDKVIQTAFREVALRLAQAGSAVTLYKALGGGWS